MTDEAKHQGAKKAYSRRDIEFGGPQDRGVVIGGHRGKGN